MLLVGGGRDNAQAAASSAFIGSGNYTRAIQQYAQCHKILSDEYGLEPSPELLSLYEEAYAYGDEAS